MWSDFGHYVLTHIDNHLRTIRTNEVSKKAGCITIEANLPGISLLDTGKKR